MVLFKFLLVVTIIASACGHKGDLNHDPYLPHGDFFDEEKGSRSAPSPWLEDRKKTYQNRLTAAPVLSYTPDADMIWGVVLVGQYKPQGVDASTRSSYAGLSLNFTNNRKAAAELDHVFLSSEEALVLPGRLILGHIPESFWGIGRDQEGAARQRVDYRQAVLEQSLLFRLHRWFYFGPSVRLGKIHDLSIPVLEAQDSVDPSGQAQDAYELGGFGLTARWDRRDSILNPSRHYLIDLKYMTYPSWSQSQKTFNHLQLDWRHYFDLFYDRSSVLAFQLIGDVIDGNPPVLELAELGGSNIMRGYYQGRFRDKNALQTQLEWRQNVYRNFGMTAFVAFGDVFPSPQDLAISQLKWSVGAGLRFNLNDHDPLHLRLDFGFGEKSQSVYLTVAEAF